MEEGNCCVKETPKDPTDPEYVKELVKRYRINRNRIMVLLNEIFLENYFETENDKTDAALMMMNLMDEMYKCGVEMGRAGI